MAPLDELFYPDRIYDINYIWHRGTTSRTYLSHSGMLRNTRSMLILTIFVSDSMYTSVDAVYSDEHYGVSHGSDVNQNGSNIYNNFPYRGAFMIENTCVHWLDQ